MIIEPKAIGDIALQVWGNKLTWLQASERFNLDDMIETFYSTRAAMQRALAGLSDAQVAYSAPENPTWSLSETVTHLIYSQNSYHNALVNSSNLANVPLLHMTEAARGYGEGAKQNQPAEQLRTDLEAATVRIREVLDRTRNDHTNTILKTPLFGDANYETFMLLMLGHELDHVRQALLMRRLSRAAVANP
jgi:uncharacterized damage-inducible protein DinB